MNDSHSDYFQHLDSEVYRNDMLNILLKWAQRLDQILETHHFANPDVPEKVLKSWLATVRLEGVDRKEHSMFAYDYFFLKAIRPKHYLT